MVAKRSSIWDKNRGKAARIALRKAENGTVPADFLATRVRIWPGAFEIALEVWLLMSRRANVEMKCSLGNAPQETTHEELATRQGFRHFVERMFEDAKSELVKAFACEERQRLGAGKSTHIDAGRSGHGGLAFSGGARRGGCRSEYKGATSTAETSDGMQNSEGICRLLDYNNIELGSSGSESQDNSD